MKQFHPGLLATALCSLLFLAVTPVSAQQTITIGPDEDVQAAVEAAPEGTTFKLKKGIYRQVAIRPKDNQRFIGTREVVFNGARLLEDWRQEDGFWVHRGLPDPLPIWDERWGTEVAQAREDLFIDDKLVKRVGNKSEVTEKTWFFADNSVYIKTDPRDRPVEYGVVPFAFYGRAANVEIRGIRVEKYAPRTHQGAIFGVRGYAWKLYDIDAQWNHAAGAVLGSGSRIYGGNYKNNGQLGIRLSGEDLLVEGAEISYNNYAGFKQNWEAGGIKFKAVDSVIRNNHVHHNIGKGIWADVDAERVIIEGNNVYNNHREGITYEISNDGIIRNNFLIDNGIHAPKVWLWGAGIIVSNSRDTEVYGNTIVINPNYGNGIAIVHKARGEKRIAVRNTIRENTIIHMGSWGKSGAVADANHHILRLGNNLFDNNTYILPSEDYPAWLFYEDKPSYGAETADPTDIGMEKNGNFVYTANPERFVDPSVVRRLRR